MDGKHKGLPTMALHLVGGEDVFLGVRWSDVINLYLYSVPKQR